MPEFVFHPAVSDWFQRRFGMPTQPQEMGWPAIQAGGHTLIAAPTGSGKTLAAFLAALDRLVRRAEQKELEPKTKIVYVSPLKALSNDIKQNLSIPLDGVRQSLWKLPLPWSARTLAQTWSSGIHRSGTRPPLVISVMACPASARVSWT